MFSSVHNRFILVSMDYQQKRKLRKLIYSRAALFLLLILICILAKANFEIYKKHENSFNNLKETKKELNNLKERQSMLSFEISKLETEEGIEEEIRSKFDVAKPGETVVVIVEDASSTEKNSDTSDDGFWKKIMNIF